MTLLEREIGNGIFRLNLNSIISEKVEAIVNPANTMLAHGGGVAGLISRTGGPAIQQESSRMAPVQTGESVFTGAGNLPFQYIIHTVGPIWQGGDKNEPRLLDRAICSVLDLAARLNLNSLSMPAVSTGIFAFPLEEAVQIIFNRIHRFLCENSQPDLVCLCEYSPDKADRIKQIIQQKFFRC